MLDSSQLGAELWLDSLPVLNGATTAFSRGAASVLQAENEKQLEPFELRGCLPADPRVRLLADPQTAGGLLACIPKSAAGACLDALRGAGYVDSACIGVMTEGAHVIAKTAMQTGRRSSAS